MKTSLQKQLIFGCSKTSEINFETVYQNRKQLEKNNSNGFKIAAVLFILLNLFTVNKTIGQNIWDGSTSNAWGTTSNWSLNHVPTSSEDVIIPNVTNDPRYGTANSTVKSITVQSGGNLVFDRSTNYALVVTNNVDVNSGGVFSVRTGGSSATSTLTIGGNLTNAGAMDFTDASVVNIIFNSTAQTINGAGTFDLNNVTTSGTGSLTLNTSSVGINSFTLNSGKTFALGTNTFFVGGSWSNAGGTVTGTGNVTFDGTGTIGGTASTTFTNLTITGTITQGINTSVSGDYIQTGGTYTQNSGATAYSLTVGGNFTLSGSSIFIMQNSGSGTGATTTVSGATGTTLSGTARILMDNGGATAANVSIFQTTNFTSSSTANSNTGIIDFGDEGNTKNNEFRISGNCSKTGATGRFYTSATPVNGGLVFNGSGSTQTVSIVASSNTEFYNITIAASAVVQLTSALTIGTGSGPASSMTVNGTLEAQAFAPAVLGGNSGTFTLASGAKLKTGNTSGVVSGTAGTISTSIPTRSFNSGASYIFSGSANQTVNFPNTTISDLTISNTGGSVTLNAAITASGDVTINSGGGSLTAGTFTHLIAGDWTNNGGTFVPGTGTISLNGTSQTIGGSSASINFNNLSLSGGTKTFSKPGIISGNLSIASTALANFGALTTNTSGTLTLGGVGTAAAKFGSTSTSATPTVYKNDTYFTAGTTGYITVGTGSCTAPTITFGSIPSVCPGVTSLSLPYTAITGGANLYSISGTGITSVTNGALAAAPSSITVALSSPAVAGTISSSAFTVSSSLTGCVSANINGSVTVNPNVGTPSFSVGATTVCQDAANTTYTATAANSTGITYSVLPSGAGTIGSLSGVMDWNAAFSGTATITATAAGCSGPTTADREVTVTPSVTTPSFTLGATTVCQDAADETYTATATNTTGITYSVSPVGAGTIDSSTGVMNWNAAFSGNATITASAAGCSPKTANRVVAVTPTVGTPSFTVGATSVCQDAANTTYTATATNNTGITYSVLPVSAGTIGASSGVMDWDSGFFGTATITATATGCNGPKSFDRVVTVSQPVTTPSFTVGATALCQDAPDTTYTATATNSTGITYTVTASAGTIGSTSGVMNWSSSFSGNATITASAAGCSGPKTVNVVVVITPSVVTPSFTAGSTSLCQDSPNNTYTATAANNTGITYSISPVGAGTINSSTGEVDWNAAYSGTATITASATGCNGPKTANRSVTVDPTVGNPSFTSGATTVCQNASSSFYIATASDSDSISYTVSPAAAGSISNVINTGFMNWSSTFSGTATITATAAGCNGPKTVDRVVTVTPTVGTPTFTVGPSTVCQDAPDTTYTATASDATGYTYSVSPAAAGTIGAVSGIINWSATFTGNATITVSAAGCNGPTTANKVVTVTPTVGAPSFTVGVTTVCQDAADTTYTATATNSTAITYTVSPVGAGTIGSSSGIIDWNSSFSGNATITASAAGCNGPKTVDRVVSVTPTVGTPIFTVGATTVCQDAADTTYTATATNSTGISYSVLPAGAGTIGASSGIINWNASFSGTATITASATGCNGPVTFDRVVTVTPTVGTPSFTTGAITVCQDAADTTYAATATNSTGISYSVLPAGAGTIGSSSGIMNWNSAFSGTATITASAAGCNGPVTFDRLVTVNPSPVVIASDVSGCSGSSIALSGSGTPIGGSGSFSIANPYVGTVDATYTYTYTDLNGCSATSAPANIIITAQPLWYLDADNDNYYSTTLPSCTSPGAGYSNTPLLGGGDCVDNDAAINPGATDICYNNIDDNCNGIKSEGCAPVVVDMTPSYDNSPLSPLSKAIPAVAYTYPGATNLKYRFSITNVTTGVTAADIIQTSRYVTIPAFIHQYNATYTIKASAVINEEVVAFAGNTITVFSPTIQKITLAPGSCGATLGALTSTISANAALNATSYTFRIRLDDGNPSPTYGYSSSAGRFINANSFTGFPLQYGTSYRIAVQYTSTDSVTNLPVESGYGAECLVITPSIPLIGLASPSCGSQVTAMNANISAAAASYAVNYQFRIRKTSDVGGPYTESAPNASRFSSLTAFGTTLAYNTQYSISVQYSVIVNSVVVWSGYGSECIVKTPFFPVTSLVQSQCGLEAPTPLTQQLNIIPYPGFPNYKVRIREILGEDLGEPQDIVFTYSYFRLNQFSSVQPGKAYSVSVAIKLGSVFGDFSTECDIHTPEAARTIQMPFTAVAYPNPFANNFMIDVKTTSQSSVNLKVYDMVGRLIDQRDVRVSDMETTTIGDQYPSGVYNVIVSQDKMVETVRVVKR